MSKHLRLPTIRMPIRGEKLLEPLQVRVSLCDAGSAGVRNAAKRCTRDTLPHTVQDHVWRRNHLLCRPRTG